MKERRDSVLEGYLKDLKGGMRERSDTRKKGSGQEVLCETGEMLDRRNTGKVEYRTGGMQDWRVYEWKNTGKKG